MENARGLWNTNTRHDIFSEHQTWKLSPCLIKPSLCFRRFLGKMRAATANSKSNVLNNNVIKPQKYQTTSRFDGKVTSTKLVKVAPNEEADGGSSKPPEGKSGKDGKGGLFRVALGLPGVFRRFSQYRRLPQEPPPKDRLEQELDRLTNKIVSRLLHALCLKWS